MYLSKLELFGFKSFANKTQINFTRGITGIVGPNGCGKTNIVDAMRWVLGEQKSSTLRSDKMENVIFNGTRLRKPMGMSEVSLTLVNDSGKLATDFSEVKVTRRIFRSGESEYLLNNNICRLKDITNLFMDTGIGANAYSVIELKMIETILSSKAEERRKLFEEAAGVNKYKLRRRLSLNKLTDVKNDLTRVNDIVAEVEKKVNSLQRQAKKADRHNQIQTVLKEKELLLSDYQFALFNKKITESDEKRFSLNSRKNEIDSSIREIENTLIEIRAQVSEIENELRLKRKEINEKTSTLHEIQKNISVNEERLKSLQYNITRFEKEIEDLKGEKETNQILIEENETKVQNYNLEIESSDRAIQELTEKIESKKSAVNNQKEELKLKNDNLINLTNDLNKSQNDLRTLKNNKSQIDNRLQHLNEKIQKITNDIAKGVGYLEELNEEKDFAKSKLESADELYTRKQREKEELEKELNSLKQKELEEKSVVTNLKNKIEFLQSLISNLEGVSKGSKVLIESKGWTQKEANLFADIGSSSSEEYRFALEAALKSVLNNLLIDNVSDLNNAVDYLKKNELGKASFYLLRDKKSAKSGIIDKLVKFHENRLKKKIAKDSEFLYWANDLINTTEKFKPFFTNVLNNIAVTKNLESAIKLNSKYNSFSFVTLNGDLVLSSGIIEAGSEPKLDDTLFGRKQIVENLRNELPTVEENLKKLSVLIEGKEEELNSIDLRILSEQGKVFLNELSNVEKQISQFEFENNKASEEIEKTQIENQELAGESNKLDTDIINLENTLKEKVESKAKAAAIVAEAEVLLNNFESEFNSEVEELSQLKLSTERIKGNINNLLGASNRAKNAITSINQNIEKRINEINSAHEEISTIQNINEEIQIDYDEIFNERKKLEEEESLIDRNLSEIKLKSNTNEKHLTEIRSEREVISDSIHDIDLDKNKTSLQLDNLVEHIKEEYSINLELKEFDDLETFDFNSYSDEVHTLKLRLKNLGPINLLAYSEYEEEKERFDFLNKQRQDLIESEKDLVNTIKEINETAERIFVETFEAIRIHFKNIFQTLFNEGDEADLKLEEGVDPLESKIEIVAKPKGKRPTGIELLSGGEKTLTATALLFAIYLVKPSPFCILDEVDAPLDDANVTRFSKLLRKFSENTQFIIITHNKRTMEASENMYGVTIQEEGISKLVGVQFNEQLEGVEEV